MFWVISFLPVVAVVVMAQFPASLSAASAVFMVSSQ